MSRLVREHDWSKTPLGPMEQWSQRLRAVVEMMLAHPMPMILMWGPQLIQIYNDGYARIAGGKHPAALGQPTRQCWPEVWHINAPIYERVLRGESVRLEDALFPVARHGVAVEDAWFTLALGPLRDDDGHIGGFLLTVTETTARVLAERQREQRQALEALHTSEERLRAILDHAPAMVYVVDKQNRFRFVNGRWQPVFGLTNQQVAGRSIYGFFPKDVADQFAANNRRVLESRSPVEVEEVVAHADGPHTYITAKVPMLDAAGQPYAVCGFSTDITDRKRAEEALRQSERRFRELADAMPQIIWITRPDGYHEYFNRRWYEFTGVPEGSTDGEGWNGLFHPDDQPRAWQRWRHSLSTGEPYEIEYRLRHRSGEYRWTLGRALPIRDQQGNIERWFGTCTDIDAMKRWTAEREHLLEREREARADAEAANRAKDKFLAVLSHELRTPLSPVVMTIPALEIDPEMPFKFRDDLAMVRRNIDLEVKLIDDLLDLSRVTSGKLRLQMQPVRLHELLLHVLRSSISEASGKRLSVRHELNASNDRLTADPARLQQVFWNLLRNAVKFTPDVGEITLRTLNDDENHGLLLVQVRDNGVGIESDVLPRIFDAFEQGDARMTRQFGGLGLGLAIAKAVVEMHGGTITADSDGRGRGATFTVRLPAVTADPAAQPGTRERESSGRRGDDRPRVLLVEDHPDTATTLARLLQSSGYRVKTAHTVASALQLAADEPFDIVVSDIGLPDATGYELMEQIRDRHGIRGIALSGYGMEEDMKKSRDAGFIEHVVKPVNVQQLEAVIGRVLHTTPPA